MTQIQRQVHDYLDKHIEIRRALANDIVSLRKLARFISDELKIEKDDAIISAIRRYSPKETVNVYEKAKRIISQTKISTKSSIVSVAIEKDEEAHTILPKLFEITQFNKGEVLRIIQAEESIKIVIDQKNLEKLKKIIPKNKIITVEKDLAEINLHLDDKAVNTPGIISVIFSELMLNQINIMETMSCVPEMLLFVKEKDLLKTYSVLYQTIKE